MDDIQFWLYLLFAIIYFISRGLKKKDAPKPSERPRASQPHQESRPKQVSFEELLKEFTEGRVPDEEQVSEKEERLNEGIEHQESEKRRELKPAFDEGTTRNFSDDESKRVYQESIKRAEGATLDFGRDEDFKSRLKSRFEKEEESTSVASDIREMLSNPEDAKKAVVLSEILTRKY